MLQDVLVNQIIFYPAGPRVRLIFLQIIWESTRKALEWGVEYNIVNSFDPCYNELEHLFVYMDKLSKKEWSLWEMK